MKRKMLFAAVLSAVFLSQANLANAEIKTIESDKLAVQIDSEFPRVIQYTWKETGDVIYGQSEPISLITVNGENETPKKVEFSSTADSATYKIRTHQFWFEVTMKVEGNVLSIGIPRVWDGGYHNLKTLTFPNHSLISVRGDQAGAAIAAARVKPTLYTGEEFFKLADKAVDQAPMPASYVVINTDKLAATIYNNIIQDSARLTYQTREVKGKKTCGVANGQWIYRQIEKEIVEPMLARIVITPDANADGTVDWQDGAIAYRNVMDSPLGSEDVKTRIASQISMNFASLAQNPFLRALDNIKKVYLYTDGLGQCVQFKGYQSEGHDSAHPDYGDNFNMRAGGQKDLAFVVDEMEKYNASAGVHINATELYPEAKNFFSEELTGKNGWAWLDASIYVDKRYDIITGNLYHRLDQLKAAVPNLDFIYVDVYFGEGWDSWKLAKKLQSLGWWVYTEFESVMERETVWIHRSQKPAGLGVHSDLIRFIRNHQQDCWVNSDLLRGSYNLGFMGWHAEHSVNAFISNVFTNNLPTKYMQHFKIVKWSDDRIDFENGVSSVREAGKVNLYKDGKLLASGVYDSKKRRMTENQIFLPWNPIDEVKIYHWNDAGGKTTWQLPASWSGVSSVKLYELTDLGRKFAADLTVDAGKVTIDARAAVPYVVYKQQPAEITGIEWGQGSPVKDPGFDSYGFAYWNKSSSAGSTDHVTIIKDERGQTHLKIAGGKDAVVSQKMTGLEAGKTYYASVWCQITGKRDVAFGVKGFGGKDVECVMTESVIPTYSYCFAKFGKKYQRMKVVFDVPAGSDSATIYMKTAAGDADSAVEFDDVRVVEGPKQDFRGHDFFEDFEWTDEGWGPFVFAQYNDTHTHLSELHEGYTDDTINGQFSLKTRNERQGLVYRSTPQLLPLAANTEYTLSFEYLMDNDGQYSVVVATDAGGKDAQVLSNVLKKAGKTFKASFTTGDFDDYYIGIVKNDKKGGVFVIDDLAIDRK